MDRSRPGIPPYRTGSCYERRTGVLWRCTLVELQHRTPNRSPWSEARLAPSSLPLLLLVSVNVPHVLLLPLPLLRYRYGCGYGCAASIIIRSGTGVGAVAAMGLSSSSTSSTSTSSAIDIQHCRICRSRAECNQQATLRVDTHGVYWPLRIQHYFFYLSMWCCLLFFCFVLLLLLICSPDFI